MGPRKFRLGRLPKNYDKPKKKTVGRPRKSTSASSSTPKSPLLSDLNSGIDDQTSSTTGCSSHNMSSSTVISDSSVGTPSADLSSDISYPSSMFSEASSDVTSVLNTETEPDNEDVSMNSAESCGLSSQSGQQGDPSSSVDSNRLVHLLTTGLQLPSERWVIQALDSDLGICKLSCNSSQTFVVLYNVIIKPDHSWTLKVYGRQVDRSRCSALSEIPIQLSMETLQSLLALLDTCNICAGNPDSDFVRMAEAKKGKLFSKNGDRVVALVDTSSDKTVRTSKCEMVVKSKKCTECVHYRNTLRKSYHRWKKQKSSPHHHLSTSSKTNLRFLNTPDKIKRYSSLRARYDAKSKIVERMKSRISALVKKNGVQIGSLSSDFVNIVHEMTNTVHQQNQDRSFRHLFWDEQVKALSKSDSRQIRWHPALIKWCLHLKFISSGAYHALRSSGVITLPSERTLRSYTHWIEAGIGFQQAVDDQLLKEMNINEEKDRYVVLCWDEVKVKEGLVFNKHNCELIGFIDLGDINNDLNRLEEECQSNPVGSSIATHVLLFMVRGLFNKVNFPYAHFATKSLTADTLFPIVWEAVERLEICGLNVIAFTSDGASANRKFYKMHRSSREVVYKTENPYREGHNIYFFSDVPHLIKTARNCWSNSFCHKESRALWVSYS